MASKNDFSRAIRGLRGMPRRLLLVGHKLAAGSNAFGTISTVSTEADAVARFGEGSMLVQMWRAARKNADFGLPIDCFAIDTGNAATAATSTITITCAGPNPNAPGEIALYIGGVRVSIGASTLDTAAALAARLAAAINANPALPVTATNTGGQATVVVTARTAGLVGNDIDLRTLHYPDDALPNGVTVAVPAMAGGAVSPNISPLIGAMALYRATEIVCPFTDSTTMGILETELHARWQANNMQDATVVNCLRGTEASISTWLATRNSPHVHTIAVTKDCTNPWETAAMAGAVIESMAAIDPAVPHTDAVLQGYMGPRAGEGFAFPDQVNNLLVAGASPLRNNQDGTGALLRMVTNYNQTNNGAADRSMAELCWIKTASYWRWFVVTEFQIKYNGYKIAEYIDEAIPGQKVMTKELGEEIMIGLYKTFCDVALMQNPDYFKRTLVVEVNGPAGKLKVQSEPVLVTQHYQTEITNFYVAGHV